MQNLISPSQRFLDKFTKEIILILARRIEEQEKQRKEEERRLTRIKLEKLKQKFDSYGEKKQIPAESLKSLSPKPQPQIHPITQIKPILPVTPAKPQQNLPMQQPMLKLLPGEINFGKILPLTRDQNITYIECPGAGKNIIIKRIGNTSITRIILSKEEIKNIIESFSAKARIPLIEGMLNARADNFEISAVVSEVLSPSFILKRNIIPLPQDIALTSPIEPSIGSLQRMPLPKYSQQKNNFQSTPNPQQFPRTQ